MSASAVVPGRVRHRREQPRENAFAHRVFHVLVDVDELSRLDREVVGFRADRRGPVALRAVDHFGPEPLPLRTKVGRWCAGRGVELPDGPLLLWTYPRVFGHVFNPVSWWFAHDVDGTLRLVIAEVNNTFGDWHAYLLDELRGVGTGRVTARSDKAFHVSPFLPVEGLHYRFAFRPPDPFGAHPGARLAAHMQVRDGAGRLVLDATQSGRTEPFDTVHLWRAVVAHPLVTLRTVVLIHAHALRLWWRRTPFHRRPEPPPTGLDAVSRPAPAAHGSEPRDARPRARQGAAS